MTMWRPAIEEHEGTISSSIVDALRADIEGGKLKAGDRLPTHRELADRLGIAIGTVSRAYATAHRQGLISGEVGRGTFVASIPVPAGGIPNGNSDSPQIDLSTNRVARDTRDPIIREGLAALSSKFDISLLLDHYQPAAGVPRHRAVAAAWLSRRGFEVAPERTLICDGAQHGLYVTLASLTKPGDVVLTEQVTYTGVKAVASLCNLDLQGLAIDNEGIIPDAFAAACENGTAKVLYCVPTFHNPTATVMSDRRRREIAEIAEANGVTIIEDDVYGFLCDESAPLPIASYLPEQTYYLNSTSKSIAPGLRVGYIVAPIYAVQRLATSIYTTSLEVSPLMAELASVWIENGTALRIIEWKRAEMRARNELAFSILRFYKDRPLSTACHIWLTLPEPWRSETFAAQARERGVNVSPSEVFVAGRGVAPHAVRVCLGAPQDRSQLEKGIRILGEILQGLPEPALAVV